MRRVAPSHHHILLAVTVHAGVKRGGRLPRQACLPFGRCGGVVLRGQFKTTAQVGDCRSAGRQDFLGIGVEAARSRLDHHVLLMGRRRALLRQTVIESACIAEGRVMVLVILLGLSMMVMVIVCIELG